MKKRLLAILLSAAMVVCLMPTMAFATEEPAVETKEEATEEVKEEVTEEKTEEVAPVENAAQETVEETTEEDQKTELTAEPAAEEETAEMSELVGTYTLTGNWDGYKFSYTKKDNQASTWADVHTTKIKVDGDVIDYKPENGVYDFTEIVNSVFAKGSSFCQISICTEQKSGSISSHEFTNIAEFYKLDVTVQVDKASSKDTTFVYDVPFALVSDSTTSAGTLLKKVETAKALDAQGDDDFPKTQNELVSNSVILKAGNTVQSGYIVYRHSEGDTDETYEYIAPDSADVPEVIGFLITEKSNNGGYTTDKSVWAGIFKDLFDGEGGKREEVYKDGFKYAKFASMNAVDAKINELNTNDKSVAEDFAEMGATLFTNDQATFTHTATKAGKGVQTSDNNELGLWIALGMMASVAAAAYALKRREN